jgi:uncharacterized protein YfaS (alpha-2-macroglobulin family)
MHGMWIKILMAVTMLAGVVSAETERSAVARGYFEKLGRFNSEETYRALEKWVFEAGQTDAAWRERVEEGAWVLTGYESRFTNHSAREVWADDYLARLEKEAGDRWWAWFEAGEMIRSLGGSGKMVDGKFVRGPGSDANSQAQDKALARQCFLKAMEMARDPGDKAEAALELAELFGKRATPVELVTKLTDLEVVPDISEERPTWGRNNSNLLVDGRSPVIGPNGEWRLPVLRETWADAKNDGERVYWLLSEAAKISPKHAPPAKLALAEMWHQLLGVDQLVELDYVYLEGTKSADDPNAKGEFDLHTLRDDETILVGKDGPERRVLPEEARYMVMMRALVTDAATDDEVWEYALNDLQDWLANRFQYDAAEEIAKLALQRDPKCQTALEFLKEIGPAGMFVKNDSAVADTGAAVTFVSRELTEQRFELWELDVERYVTEHGKQTMGSWDRGPWEASSKDFEKYGRFFKEVKSWVAPLAKKGNHMQSRNRVKVPVERAGTYLVVAMVGGGCQTVPLVVSQTILLSADLGSENGGPDPFGHNQREDLFLIDAISGEPIEGALAREAESGDEVVSDHTGSLLGLGSQDGVLVKREGLPTELLYVGGNGYRVANPEEVQSFLVTDQPLYRPGQKVSYAGWLRRPDWRKSTGGDLGEGAEVWVKVTDPVGILIHEKKMALDEFDGFSGSFDLASEMVLGDCNVELSLGIPESEDPFAPETKMVKKWNRISHGSWKVAVGEFRKPDFQVKLEAGPDGADFTAKVRASYLSGEAVKGAQVKAKLRAYPIKTQTFPKLPWDELYQAGYDWPLPVSKEIEGWAMWGVRSEYNQWMAGDEFGEDQIIEVNGVTDGKGRATLIFPKDLPLLGRCDYDCTVRVDVQEFTGRSIRAESKFVFSGRDHEVLAKPEKGFYRAGEKVKIDVSTMTADRSPVAGKGVLTVDAIDGEGGFQKMAKMDFVTDGEGRCTLDFMPPSAGRYRCVAESGGGKRGFVLEVLGDGMRGYQGVHLIPSKVVGQPGERIEILIATEEAEALVWLFEQMPDGLKRTPRMLRTKGHTAVIEIPLTRAGMPDFFLQAATLVKGKVAKDSCRIVMPPEDTRLDVAMAASPTKGEPGDQVAVEIGVKDARGKPARASLAVAAFDRALEDLSGRWPDAGSSMRDAFEEAGAVKTSQDEEDDRYRSAFDELSQPGCFFARSGLSGKPPWGPEGRFVVPGSELWVGYEPPQLPNSVGSSDSFGSAFPVTPATPTAYSNYGRGGGREVALSAAEKAGMAAVELRKNFTDRVYWGAAMTTDAEGKVRAEFKLPENLTTWRVRTWAFGRERSYGDAQVDIEVSKRLQLRPLLPLAAVAGDELQIGVMVQNLSEAEHEFAVTMEVDGVAGSDKVVKLAAGAEGKLVWKQKMERAGKMTFRFRAKSADGSLQDGVESSVPVAARTTPVTVSRKAEIRGENREVTMDLAADELVANGSLRVRVEANPAVSALAVLPDLAGYPYGCTEQTLNRFLPTLIAWKAAKDLGLDWAAMTKIFADDKTPLGWVKGRAAMAERPAELTESEVRTMIYAGLGRLKEKQGPSGAWGWFSADDQESSAYMTALVVRGLFKARKLGFSLDCDPAESGVKWLENYAIRRTAEFEKSPLSVTALDAWVAYVLSEVKEGGGVEFRAMLVKVANNLPAFGLVHLALAMDPKTDMAEMKRLRAIAEQTIKSDGAQRWQWWNDPTELRAWHLKLLVKMGADREELERGIRELLILRKDGIRWNSTKDSALCVETIIEAAQACGGFDFKKDESIEVTVDAVGRHEVVTLDRKHLWTAYLDFSLAKGAEGHVPVVVKAGGDKPIMAIASMSYDSTAAGRMAASNDGIAVERRYFRVNENGKRVILADGEKVSVGELIEVELKVMTEDGLSYVHLRDPIPAGLEPLEQLSGYDGGAYRESRHGETSFFFSSLSSWNQIQRYRLRAVTEGDATALPARAECMYAPEIGGQSGLRKIEVVP